MPCGCYRPERKRHAYGPCEVCGWARGDWTPRKVTYCEHCKAWICDACWNDWPARIKAALLRKRARLTGEDRADH